jgi:hypothetical protein
METRGDDASVVRAEGLAFDDRENVALAHDEVVLAVHRDLGAGVLAVQYRVADLDLHLDQRARV